MASLFAADSSSLSRQKWKYDVFLSFRGKDTRNNFTSHLYKELCRKGIITFKDDRELPKGESVPQQLHEAIQESRILVVIFSKNYADSIWCLNELVNIFECKKAGRQTVLPIFYDVSPSEVRKQDGTFEKPFIEYEKLYKENIEKVQEWRVASKEVANLSGWDLKDRDESDFIEAIIKDIISKLRRLSPSISKDFVGMHSRLEKMIWYLDIGQLDDVKIIGICGMGGIGKTTIASVVYKEFFSKFEGCSFLADVRETSKKHGLISLQKQLLSASLGEIHIEIYDIYKGTEEIRCRLCCKKVLVILDDVDHLEQIEVLIGKRDENWFGVGSRIIITTRDEHLLTHRGVDEIYRVGELNYGEALQLFRLKAFKNGCKEEYVELSNQVVEYAGGLPLALGVLGSSLYGKSVREWKSMLDRLKEIPNENILSRLQISFDGLEEINRKIFLDIACFFKGKKIDYVMKVFECCGFHPDIGIRELVDKSLITVTMDCVWMHDLLQELGQEIVRRESRDEPGQRSRIWHSKDLYHVLVNDKETEQIEGIVLDYLYHQEEECLSAKGFSKMKNMRLLILQNAHFFHEVEYLSNQLRYLEWHRYLAKFFPSNFQPDRLVWLRMRYSSIERLWKGMKLLKSLKAIDLSYSANLIKTPNFKAAPSLERLNFQGCIRLVEVHQSIGVLQRLVSLNLRLCKNLAALPDTICNLKSLKILNLHGCSKLDKMPEKLGDLTCLEELDLAGTSTRQLSLTKALDFLLPSWLLPRMTQHPLVSVLPSLATLHFLRTLDLSYCKLPDEVIPKDLSCFPLLKYLDLSGNNFVSIPSSLIQLSQLTDLSFANCKMLKSLPDLPSSIELLHMENCTSLETLPNLLEKRNVKFFRLSFWNCSKLNDYQGKFTILKNYLLSYRNLTVVNEDGRSCNSWDEFVKICHQRCIDPSLYCSSPEFYLFLPGSEVPLSQPNLGAMTVLGYG